MDLAKKYFLLANLSDRIKTLVTDISIVCKGPKLQTLVSEIIPEEESNNTVLTYISSRPMKIYRFLNGEYKNSPGVERLVISEYFNNDMFPDNVIEVLKDEVSQLESIVSYCTTKNREEHYKGGYYRTVGEIESAPPGHIKGLPQGGVGYHQAREEFFNSDFASED